ncbi:MAG: DUF512 domain-containing protein, partial [Pyrinomonadaceae bacterium]
LTRYNTDERLTRVTAEFCRRTIREVEKLQKEFRKNLGVTFAFLGDEIYIKAGAAIPSRRHYGNYPQIEDGVGMVRSFVNVFEAFLSEPVALALASAQGRANERIHPDAMLPRTRNSNAGVRSSSTDLPPAHTVVSDFGTLLTGEMFAPILREQIDRYNEMTGSRLHVLAVPNTYFGGDVSVAGLLTGKDFLAVRDKIVGDFVTIPKITIKSDEPIFLDGMGYEELKAQFNVPVYDLDTAGLIEFLSK